MDRLYELEDIRQVYAERTVLEIDRLLLYKGEITGIYGPNGSGKSTLLRLLALLESPVKGTIRFKGRPAHPGILPLRQEVTLLPQSPYLLKRSVLNNVLYGLKVRKLAHKKEIVHEALQMVGLDSREFAGRRWHELSGGEAQRVALAARLALKPEVLLLDEPTAYLDEDSSERIRSAALFAREKWNTALVLVSHDHEWLRSVSERMLYMNRGRIKEAIEPS